ncbi:gag pro pol polyprotein [Echinococcus multilocularis]|uniref:Gag pro pol polyprotein n=1 Tax=Echinococcus multilocularis TaxID=6211 RepID=A0A068XZY4_ECHMU|nr:gag pro pol polyprotein [Echinococcus multilocularis]
MAAARQPFNQSSVVEWPHEGTLHLDKILAVKIKTLQTPGGPLSKDQCAYCKEKGHWIKDCPKRTKKPEKPNAQALETQVLTLDDDSD